MQPIEKPVLSVDAWELFNTSHDKFVLLQDQYMPEGDGLVIGKLLATLDQDVYQSLELLRKAHRGKLEDTLIDIGIRAFAGVLVLRGHERAA